MADTRLSDLSAAGALSASDLFYVVQTPGSGGAKATGTQLLTLVGTTYVAKAGGTMTGALTVASGTLTASAPALSVTQTWNNAAVNFTGALIDITTTAASTSYALRVRNNGVDTFNLRQNGVMTLSTTMEAATINNYGEFRAVSTGLFGFSDNPSSFGTIDLRLYRDAAATLAQRNGTTQQIFRLYNTYTDSSNYERLTLTGVAGSSVNITAETLGTGGDNLDIVLTPAGTGRVLFGGNFYFYPSSGISIVYSDSAKFSFGASSDTGFGRLSAGVLEVTNSTSGQWRDLKLRNLLQTEYQQMTEMTAPAAPATNSVRIYAEDNGSGKTRLMALFATGVAQQIAIEP